MWQRLCCAILSVWLLVGQAAAADLSTYTFVHDPSMMQQGKLYVVFSTGDPNGVIGFGNIQVRTSTDMKHWHYRGTVFEAMPDWLTTILGPITNLWAPDISYWGGLYHLYYAGSLFGKNTSVIGLATNSTLDPASPHYHWVDRGLVIQSDARDDWNAIDPNLSFDKAGHPWLAFGSFWSGIKMRRIDPATGLLAAQNTTLYSLASRPASTAVEAASILRHGRYFYLFTSFDRCCQGVASTYHIMVGRATQITGPYQDRAGTPSMQGGGTLVLASNGNERGPGGQTAYHDGAIDWLVYHYYDAAQNGAAKLQIRQIHWSADGWPQVGPRVVPAAY